LVPNQNYCLFEDWVNPILLAMTQEQINGEERWSPSKVANHIICFDDMMGIANTVENRLYVDWARK
jgi:hypothetical protein